MANVSEAIGPGKWEYLWWDTYYQNGMVTETYSLPIPGCLSHNVNYTTCEYNTSSTDDKWYVQKECIGHRNLESNTNTFPTEIDALTIIKAEVIDNLRAIIKKELQFRKINGKYRYPARNCPPISLNDSIVKINTTALAKVLNTFAEHLRPQKSPDDTGGFMRDTYCVAAPKISSTLQITAKNYNDIVTATTGLMNDCICYADCNGYSVCWCYGNCYNY